MIPHYEVETTIEVGSPPKRLSPETVVHGFEAIRDYEPLLDLSWAEVDECLRAEEAWLEYAASADNEASFDEILSSAHGRGLPHEISEDPEEPDFDELFRYLDIGVAGLVYALSAAGYATCSSCRGHPGISRPPQVGFGTEPERLSHLIPYVERSGCGMEVSGGVAWIYSNSVTALHALAQMLFDHRAHFESMARPPWLDAALALLERDDSDE
ncbi:hypothetical protein AB0H43_13480 [Hamadaea sp. NPDC050747]|uniref:hypothetical protein n=1 Tax=Hamadaea sp. NPDC050747 TaxID=3155789 RepID=UPI0033FD901A